MNVTIAAKLRGMKLPRGYNIALLHEAANALEQAELERHEALAAAKELAHLARHAEAALKEQG